MICGLVGNSTSCVIRWVRNCLARGSLGTRANQPLASFFFSFLFLLFFVFVMCTLPACACRRSSPSKSFPSHLSLTTGSSRGSTPHAITVAQARRARPFAQVSRRSSSRSLEIRYVEEGWKTFPLSLRSIRRTKKLIYFVYDYFGHITLTVLLGG